jgi:hypothetical protein
MRGFIMTTLRWKVGATQATMYSPSQRHGFSFAVQNVHGAPLLNITYASESESKEAETAVRKAIEKAVDIMGYNGT